MTKEIDIFSSSASCPQKLPFASSEVAAGFPSSSDESFEKKLDLNELLISHPAATFFVRVRGDSMVDAGIFSKDLLIVDKSLEPRSGNIVVALYQGEFTVKRLIKEKTGCTLLAANPAYPPLKIEAGVEFQIWGVVTHVIHTVL